MNVKIPILLLMAIVVCAIVVPLLSPHGYAHINLALKNSPPSWHFPFGTDNLGRDLFVRLFYGVRISLMVGFGTAFLDFILGGLWGSIAAFTGGKVDELLMRIADIVFAIPYLLLVILLTLLLGQNVYSIILSLSLLGWVVMAKVIRGHILKLEKEGFILASRAMGGGFLHILFTHFIPHSWNTLIVAFSFTIPSAIFGEAFLSFVGLGIQAPQASLGTMAAEGLPALEYYPWRLFFPAFFIFFIILTFNLLGNALSSAKEKASHKGHP